MSDNPSKPAPEFPRTLDGVMIVPEMVVWRIGDLWIDDEEDAGKPFDCGIAVEDVRMVPNNRHDGWKWRVKLEGCPTTELYSPEFLYSSWQALKDATDAKKENARA